jgi:hypothetical protein
MTNKSGGTRPTSDQIQMLKCQPDFSLSFELWHCFGIWILAFGLQSDTPFSFLWHFWL